MPATRPKQFAKSLPPIDLALASLKVNLFDRSPNGIARKKAACLKMLEKTLGVRSATARALGINRRTINVWIHADPEFAAAVFEIQERALDFVETHLFKNIQAGKEASIIFYLKTKGRSRGYVKPVKRIGNLEALPRQVSAMVITAADLRDDISPAICDKL